MSSEEAIDALLSVWSDYTMADIGPHLTCNETDALAAFLSTTGRTDMAEALIEGHAEADDEGDAHYTSGEGHE